MLQAREPQPRSRPIRYPDDLFGPGSPIRVIGHRGAAAAAPENTLPSFAQAREVGADAVELDLHCSADGRLMVIHDPELGRTTDGHGAVEERTAAELAEFDAGYRFTTDGGRSFPFRGQGVRIPTLEQVLETVGSMPVVTEIKSTRAGQRLGEWLRESPERERILVGGFDGIQVEPAGREARWRCTYQTELRPYVLLGKVGLARFAAPDVDAAMVPETHRGIRIVSRGFVKRAHADGIGVFVWTVNRADDMRRLFDWGVDGLVSDAPGRLRRIVDERIAAGIDPSPALATCV